MSYEYIQRAQAALAQGKLQLAAEELYGSPELLDRVSAMTPAQLRETALREQAEGYGLRAEVLECLANRKERAA